MRIRKILSMILYILIVLLLVGCVVAEEVENTTLETKYVIGSVVRTTSSTDAIACGTTRETYKQLNKYIVAGDKTGAEIMLRKGQILLLETGIKVKIIQVTSNGVEVRIQEGAYTNKIAWIQLEFLKW